MKKHTSNNLKDLTIFGLVFGSVFKLVQGILSSKQEKKILVNSANNNFDSYIANIFIHISNAIKNVQPLLNFNEIFESTKKYENDKDLSKLLIIIRNNEHETTNTWKIVNEAEMKLDQIILGIDTSASNKIQKIQNEMSKLRNFGSVFKGLLVLRGQILRHVRDIYNGKNKREETRIHEKERLKILVQLFNNDANKINDQISILNEVIQSISRINRD